MKKCKRLRLATILPLLGLGLGLASPAWAQPSGRQTTPDGRNILVNRAEGGLQWAISYTPNEGTITGNVFDPGGGDPSYIWCERVGDDGSRDPAAIQIDWRCEGASECAQSPCDASGWIDLGLVRLGGFFFLPARDPFVTLQKPGSYCDPIRFGFSTEFGAPSWEVDTSVCPYASMSQPIRTPVEAGEDIVVRVWHWKLLQPAGGALTLTVLLGDELIHSEEVKIPRDATLFGPRTPDDEPLVLCLHPKNPAPAGTPISWNLQIQEPSGEAVPTGVPTESIPELGRPLHSDPGVTHMLELTVGSNCEGEPAGRPLVTHDTWEHVSEGLPPLP